MANEETGRPQRRSKAKADAPAEPPPPVRSAQARPDAPQETNVESPTISVVGIGASAGGIEALGRFFDAMPADSGCAFV
ncbi:hypothetical protein EN788_47155, partial [Mesorhizobium sp. M2D.F.Ca.ET.145.01.1.1]